MKGLGKLTAAIGIAGLLVLLPGCDFLGGVFGANQAPQANAGPDQTVVVGAQVTLDGTDSTDVDSDPLTYAWSFTSVPSGSGMNDQGIQGATGSKAYFTPDVVGSYVIELVVSDGTDSASDSTEVTAQAPTAVPAAPAITATGGDGQVTISWVSVSTATSYNLYWTAGSTVAVETGTKVAGVTSPCVLSGLTNGTQYAFVLTAVNTVGEGAASNVATATPQIVAPAAPTITAAAGDGQVTVTWAAVSGATSYNLYWGVGSTVTVQSGTKVEGVVSPSTVSGLSSRVLYAFAATALNSAGESVASSVVTASPVSVPIAPATQVFAADSQVTVTWGAISTAASYNLYYAAGATVTAQGGTKVSGVTSPWTVVGLANEITYAFVVTAVNAAGEGPASDVKTAVPQAAVSPPGSPGIAASGGDALATVTWTNVAGAISYNLYYEVGVTVTVARGTRLAGVTTPRAVTGLTNGTRYAFIVTAVNAVGESAPSNVVTATPLALPAAPPVWVSARDGAVQIGWDFVGAATSYNIYYAAGSTVTKQTGIEIAGELPPYVVSGLANGTQYAFIVTAVGQAGEGDASTVMAATPEATVLPQAPTGLSVVSSTAVSLTVSWDSVGGASWYELYRDVVTPSGTFDESVYFGIATSVVDSGLSSSTTYHYRVSARNSHGESPLSEECLGATGAPAAGEGGYGYGIH